MKNPILIRNIRHLTDARYFAAMEVDWMSMELSEDPVSFSVWHNLKEWISGVKLAAELLNTDEAVVAKTIIDAKPDGIIVENLDLIHLTGGMNLFLLTETQKLGAEEVYAQIMQYREELPKSIMQSSQLIYLEADWTPEMIGDVKSKNFTGGFSFMTSAERDTGMKDFSAMDTMLEMIRN